MQKNDVLKCMSYILRSEFLIRKYCKKVLTNIFTEKIFYISILRIQTVKYMHNFLKKNLAIILLIIHCDPNAYFKEV